MPHPKGWDLPPPEHDQEFENLCLDLIKAVRRPIAEPNLYGRSGQTQHGVDFVLQLTDGLHAYQCKRVRSLSPADFKTEVAKLAKFPNPLRSYTVLTTAENDARLQDVMLALSDQRLREGLHPVSIVFWTTIRDWLVEHPIVLSAHYPCITLRKHDTTIESPLNSRREMVAKYLREHLRGQLRALNPRHRESLTRPVENLLRNHSVVRRLPRSSGLEDKFSNRLLRSEQLGMMNQNIQGLLRDGGPITVATPHSMTATVAILVYLRDVMALPIRIAYAVHTPDIVHGITTDRLRPQFCVLTDATFIALGRTDSDRDYAFCTFLPCTQLRIVTKSRARAGGIVDLGHGVYYFLEESLSTPRFLFEQMREHGIASKRRCKSEHREPDESPHLLRAADADLRIIVWDAHWRLYEQEGLCAVQLPPPGCVSRVECMLFGLRDLPKVVSQSVVVAIRHAWMELLSEDALVRTIGFMLQDDDFVVGLLRACGLP